MLDLRQGHEGRTRSKTYLAQDMGATACAKIPVHASTFGVVVRHLLPRRRSQESEVFGLDVDIGVRWLLTPCAVTTGRRAVGGIDGDGVGDESAVARPLKGLFLNARGHVGAFQCLNVFVVSRREER